ncbi:MAG TPA: hypothetical protein VIX37_14215 [Candidatus Sulfotelmatobacter sp.]
MRHAFSVMLAAFGLSLLMLGQDAIPAFRTEATNAFVWGDDNRAGAVSSSVEDPITGNAIHKVKHAGVEVSSRAGFERVGVSEVLSFTTTIVNSTQSEIRVRQGGVTVDGHAALPIAVVATKKGLKKREGERVLDVASMQCFANRFLENEEFFSAASSTEGFAVRPNHALTVSYVTKDPRYSSVLCSAEGCHPKGTMRFSVVVNATVFVFLWPGGAVVSCGS